MNFETIYSKALALKFLTPDEGLKLYTSAPTDELIFVASQIRQKLVPGNKVTWIIDRNVNITNICYSQCKFCNFYRKKNASDGYITSIEEYQKKIKTLFNQGGNQLLLQGGLHPKLGLGFYTGLFSRLKELFPELRLHALSPPEIVHIARKEKLSFRKVLEELVSAGLDSLPGAGAEILCDHIRKELSPLKANTGEWLDVMREAHKMNLVTSATMMFGHIESKKDRIAHLKVLRDLQSEKPDTSPGFIAFIPWTFQDQGTVLKSKLGIENAISSEEYIRTIALSRIFLPNIKNIQASWLTVGKSTGQLCLHAGANDFGSIMIEENVVSAAGASHKFDAESIQAAIREAGFIPQLRNQAYVEEWNDGRLKKSKSRKV
ncbi:MAG: dehypoxanthine futalosine cyclase [Bacteroidetes bacterium]|nr:dehypoxanthine futalosine cyclase [Bacteroidota bacterium]